MKRRISGGTSSSRSKADIDRLILEHFAAEVESTELSGGLHRRHSQPGSAMAKRRVIRASWILPLQRALPEAACVLILVFAALVALRFEAPGAVVLEQAFEQKSVVEKIDVGLESLSSMLRASFRQTYESNKE